MGYNSSIFLLMPKYDPDALAFINATGITDGTQKNAINYLVVNLKSIGVWSKIFALYPFVGGTATTHKYNLKDPNNTDAAMRIVFSGAVTHDANGITTDGVSGYGNTHAIALSRFSANNECMFLYSRTSAASPSAAEVDMGCAISITSRDALTLRSSLNGYGCSFNSTTNGTVATTSTDASGFFVGSRVNSTDLRIFKNSSQVGVTQTALNNGTRCNLRIYIGCRNVSNLPNGLIARNYAFAGMSSGLTAGEVSSMYPIVQQYQTLLGRQV